MDHTMLIIKTCLMSGLFLLIFFGLFFRLLQTWCFQRKIAAAVVIGKQPPGDQGKSTEPRKFILQVEAAGNTLSLRCPAELYHRVRVGDRVALVCRGSRVKELMLV